MKLEVHERLIVLDLLPKEDDYAGMKALRRFKEGVNFSPDEVEYFELKIENGQYKWNSARSAEKVKDVPMELYVTDILRDALSKLNKEHKLREEHMSLYDKLIVAYK